MKLVFQIIFIHLTGGGAIRKPFYLKIDFENFEIEHFIVLNIGIALVQVNITSSLIIQ